MHTFDIPYGKEGFTWGLCSLFEISSGALNNIDDFDRCTKKLDITISQYSLFLKVLCLLSVDYHILVGSVACTPCFCLDSLVALIVQFRFRIPFFYMHLLSFDHDFSIGQKLLGKMQIMHKF